MRALLAPVFLLTLTTPVFGQGSRWEVEGQIGVAISRTSAGGALTLPQPGLPITTSSPIAPSRAIPSWLFGDGTSLLNNVLGQFEVPFQVTPIEAALGSGGSVSASSTALSVRVRRNWRPRWWIEGSLDFTGGSAAISDSVVAGMEATRASFTNAFASFLMTGPIANIVIDAPAPAEGGSASRSLTATGALQWRFREESRWTPYLTFGGGVTTGAGDGSSATLDVHYRFNVSIPGVTAVPVPFAENDHVTLRASEGTTWTGVAGGGLRRDMSARWGIAIDGRVFIGPDRSRLTLDATPSVTTGTPADFLEILTSPAIQFSNQPPGGRVSTLSGPALQDFELRSGEGLRTRVLITGGVFFRF